MRRKTKGFTLIEIMLVVMIVGLLVGITVPRMKGTFAMTRLKASGRDIAGLLRYARTCAVFGERSCEVRFMPETSQYQLVVFDKDGERIDPAKRRRYRDDAEEQLLSAQFLELRDLPKDVYFAAIYSSAETTEDEDLPRIIYYPDGSASAAVVCIQDKNRRAITVEVYRTTGMARVNRGLPIDPPEERILYYGPGYSPQKGGD